jgi:hypothetical protein
MLIVSSIRALPLAVGQHDARISTDRQPVVWCFIRRVATHSTAKAPAIRARGAPNNRRYLPAGSGVPPATGWSFACRVPDETRRGWSGVITTLLQPVRLVVPAVPPLAPVAPVTPTGGLAGGNPGSLGASRFLAADAAAVPLDCSPLSPRCLGPSACDEECCADSVAETCA